MFSCNKCIILEPNLSIIFSVAFDYLMFTCCCSDEKPVTKLGADELSVTTETLGVEEGKGRTKL